MIYFSYNKYINSLFYSKKSFFTIDTLVYLIKMETHIATIGHSKDPIMLGIRAFSIDKLVLLYTKNEDSISNSKEICEQMNEMKIICERILIDPFDFNDIVLKILKISENNIKDAIYVNITGGTKIMASSAMLAGYILGLNVYYFLDDRLDVNKKKPIKELLVELPVPKISFRDLDQIQKKIISLISEYGGTLERVNSVVHEKFQIPKQNVSYHIKQLHGKDLIELEIHGRNKIARLTNTGNLYAQMISK